MVYHEKSLLYCPPPPPTTMNFNNYSELKLGHASHQFEKDVYSLDILCLYEEVINEIGKVQPYKADSRKGENLKINGFNTIKFAGNIIPNDSSKQNLTHYIVNRTKGYRITHSGKCPSCKNVAQNFQFK